LAKSLPAQANNVSGLTESLRERLRNDPLRPQYHLIPQSGSVGDPCAPRFFNGKYHVFYHNDFGGHGWAHATSADLIHWDHLPFALSPTAGFFDAYGCFTGSVLPGTEIPSVIYAAVTRVPRAQETIRAEGLREVQCIATSTDPDLRSWHKLDQPVIDPPSEMKIVGFRDPFAWKEDGIWYVGVGSGFPQQGGTVLLYRSHDARHFEYVHPLAQGTWNGKSFTNPVGSGEMWECPDFFPLGDKHVLIYSTEYITYWEVGTFDKRALKFYSERKGYLDHGAYYAPKTMLDNQGRRLLWGWVQETRPAAEVRAAGWSGAISLPRVLTLSPQGELQMNVPPEFNSMRRNTVTIRPVQDASEFEASQLQAVIHGRAGEVVCTLKAGESDWSLGLYLGTGPDELPFFKVAKGVNIGETPSIMVGDRTLPLHPDENGDSTLHLWMDGSIIELFVDGKQVITVRTYAAKEGISDIHARWTGDPKSLISMSVSDIIPISNDRMTS
jgi:beta-fructofuranosidase